MLFDLWQTLARSGRSASEHLAEGGILELADLAVLVFEGRDAVAFLQGYFTCDTAALRADAWRGAAICNLKGRVVASGFARRDDADRVSFLVHASLVTVVEAFLRPYLAFSKTRIRAAGADALVLGLLGEPFPGAERLEIPDTAGDGQPQIGIAFVETADALEEVVRGRRLVTGESWLAASIRRRIVWLDATLSARFLPQMLGLVEQGAVDFAKGCYLGQEVVARAEHRGKVKRSLRLLRWSGAHAPALGADVEDDAQHVVGTVVATTADTAGERLCLAVVKADAPVPLQQRSVRLDAPG